MHGFSDDSHTPLQSAQPFLAVTPGTYSLPQESWFVPASSSTAPEEAVAPRKREKVERKIPKALAQAMKEKSCDWCEFHRGETVEALEMQARLRLEKDQLLFALRCRKKDYAERTAALTVEYEKQIDNYEAAAEVLQKEAERLSDIESQCEKWRDKYRKKKVWLDDVCKKNTRLNDDLAASKKTISLLKQNLQLKTGQVEEYEKIQSLKSELSYQARVQCVVCMDAERSVVLKPCNHLVTCGKCTEQITGNGSNKCPVCRKQITDFTLCKFL